MPPPEIDPPNAGCACNLAAASVVENHRLAVDDGGPWMLFDDLILRQNEVTDSEIFPITDKNRFLISGLVIARTAVATITFTPLVSTDGANWTLGGTAINVSSVGYFSNSGALAINLNARFLKVRGSNASAAIVSTSANISLGRV